MTEYSFSLLRDPERICRLSESNEKLDPGVRNVMRMSKRTLGAAREQTHCHFLLISLVEILMYEDLALLALLLFSIGRGYPRLSGVPSPFLCIS